MISIDKSSQGKTISAKKGDLIKVQLPENPTTGYLWKINSIDDKHLKYKEEKHENSGGGIGAGRMKTIYIDVIAEGTSELNITLGNPWEEDAVETFRVSIESK